MTFFKKKGVAWTVLIVSVIAAVFIGTAKAPDTALPPDVDVSEGLRYVDDRGNLLSASTEEQIAKKNARWDYEYDAHVAVVTTDDDVDVADYADDTFDDMDLEPRDILLVLAENGDWYVLPGYDADKRLTDSHYDNIGWAIRDHPDNDEAVDEFLDAVDSFYADRLDRLPSSMESSGGSSILLWIVVIIVVILLISVITSDLRTRRRYTRPRTTRTSRPVVVTPPYRRPYQPTTTNRRPTGGFGGTRSGGTFSSRPSGGFGGSRSSRSSGGFGGSRSSGGRSSGGFGGSRGGGRGGRR